MKTTMKFVTISILATAAMACTAQPSSDVAAVGAKPKAVVRAYIERVINGDDWSAWDELFPESVSFNGQSMTKGDMQQMTGTFKSILGGMRLEVVDQVAEGDTVATRVTIHGTHIGDYMGIKATGQDVSFSGLAYDRVVDGRVVEMWHEMNIWGTLLTLDD